MRGTFSRNVVLLLRIESKDARIGPFVSLTLIGFAVRMTLRQQPDVIKLLIRLEICSRTYIAGVDDVDGFHSSSERFATPSLQMNDPVGISESN